MRRLHATVCTLMLARLTVAGTAAAQLPAPLLPPSAPLNNAVTSPKAALGKALFWDEQLSSSRTVACGTCHQARAGGSDPRSRPRLLSATHPGADGIAGTGDDVTGSPGVVLRDAAGSLGGSGLFGMHQQVTPRLAASHINAAYAPWLFWDGRAPGRLFDPESGDLLFFDGASLENQALEPPLSTTEMGHTRREWADVISRLAGAVPLALAMALPSDVAEFTAGRSYPQLFTEAFGTSELTLSRIVMAIGSYERMLFSNQSPFDSLLAGTATLRPDEAAGLQVFQSHCASCHSGALLTDQQFHAIGVRPAAEDSGRFAVSRNAVDLGAFRTPSLRNVALRAAFMHDGRFASVAEVVDFYDRGGDFAAPNKDARITPLGLSAEQRSRLIAFLGRPLTDPRVAAATSPFDQPALFGDGDLVPHVLSGGIDGASGAPPLPVALEPALAGNATFSVGVTSALGGATAILVIDDAVPELGAGIPSTASFARQAVVLQGSGGAGGHGSATLQIPGASSGYGRVLFGRWYVNDPGATGGVAASAPFRFTIFGPHGEGAAMPGAGARVHTPAALASAPNPFVLGTTLRFELLRATRARLGIYDVHGRRVRRLFDQPIAMAGSYAMRWDGRDDRGAVTPMGVYFAQLETQRETTASRLVRLR